MKSGTDGFLGRVDALLISRVVSLFLGLGTGGVLATAMWLDADPAGHGTHLQLGLNPCSFLTVTGWPCPMCGATTTFTLMAHMRPIEAVTTQPFAAILFVLTVAVFGVSVAEVVAPRHRWKRLLDWIQPVEGWLAAGFLGLMALGWAYKAWAMGMFAA